MKYILLILISISAYSKTIRIKYDWNCERVSYSSSTLTLPEQTSLKIKFKSNNGQIDIEPNIFNELSTSGKESYADSDSCIAKMVKSIDKSVATYLSSCNNCDFNKEKVMTRFNQEVFGSAFFKATEKLQKFPRVYLGHRDYDQSQFKNILTKVCNSHKLNSEELINTVGLKFVDYMIRRIKSDKKAFDKSCIENVISIQNKFRPDDLFCETNSCKEIVESQKYLDRSINTLKQSYEKVNRSEDDQNLIDNGFRPRNSFVAEHFQTKAFPESQDNEYSCDVDYRMPATMPNRYSSSLFEYDHEISDIIGSKLSNMSKHCVRNFLRTYISTKEKSKDANNPLCDSKYCKDRVNVYHDNLQRILAIDHNSDQIEYFCKNISSTGKNYKAFEELWEKVDEAGRCSELKEGETRVLSHSRKSGNLSHHHSIKKISKDKYEAKLALKFNTGDPAKDKKYFDKVNTCMKSTSKYFKSPDGKSMDLKIITESENKNLPRNERLKVQSIGLQGVGARSHSRAYAADINCQTITHEVLHLMGLADEYHESVDQVYYNEDTKEAYHQDRFPADKEKSQYKKKLAYNDCRAITNTDSVMKSQGKMFAKSVKEKIQCECHSKSCKDFMANEKLAKLSLSNPIDYNDDLYKYCKNDRLSSIKLSQPSEKNIKTKNYQNIKYSKNYLSFEYQHFENTSSTYSKPLLYNMKWSCNCTDDKCRELISNYKKKTLDPDIQRVRSHCPWQTSEKKVDNPIVSPTAYGFKHEDDGTFSFITTPKQDSLLHPAHFEKMVWGSCSTKAKKYNKCTSYFHSLVSFQCEDRPDYCNEDNAWLK